MNICHAQHQQEWDTFLSRQQYRPFLQSWTMGEVYNDVGQKPIRLEIREEGILVGICFALLVPAKRGRHLFVPYGPIILPSHKKRAMTALLETLKQEAQAQGCSFVRLSPFWKQGETIPGARKSPMHVLAEHLWYIPLTESDVWINDTQSPARAEEEIMMNMRKTSRNLVRRAQKEGVTIERSKNPREDLDRFITLHEETRKRHAFTPYTNAFFEAQVRHFSLRNECTMYKAVYQNTVIACSIHIHAFGETSYHHGASTHAYAKIPASYLLQWTAITDALKRGDRIYNFWGIAPVAQKSHPFSGVTTFKKGFGGNLLDITHCMDVPVHPRYYCTRAFEILRKWRRGF